jgi:predicted Zn-dependent protease
MERNLVEPAVFAGAAMPQAGYLGGRADYLQSVCAQGMYQWTHNRLPIKVFIGPGSAVSGYRPQFDSMISNAFDTWCAASGNTLSWQQVDNAAHADVVISWTNHPTQRVNGTEAGETNAYAKLDHASGRGVIYGAKMSILTELNGQPFSDQFMEKTILHETGHALGLQGHSPVRTDIMYYSINNDQEAQLTERDRTTMARLYADYQQSSDVAVN